LGRLSMFLAVYAFSFGNHLGMILFAPAFALYLFLAAPGGWRALLTPRIVALAVGAAVVGASQYAWNLSALCRRISDLLVRRHQGRLAGLHGSECSSLDGDRTARDVRL
jgi:hypothetical protein